MNEKEIRIGNWVDAKGNKEQVWGIKPDRRNHLMVNDWEIEVINPIPLTEEWLLKFGFTDYEWCDDCAFIKCGNYHLMVRLFKGKWYITRTKVSKDKDGHMTSGHKDVVKKGLIKYVHQLQNLYFALTGEELTIKE